MIPTMCGHEILKQNERHTARPNEVTKYAWGKSGYPGLQTRMTGFWPPGRRKCERIVGNNSRPLPREWRSCGTVVDQSRLKS